MIRVFQGDDLKNSLINMLKKIGVDLVLTDLESKEGIVGGEKKKKSKKKK
jgi:hypothetical protein